MYSSEKKWVLFLKARFSLKRKLFITGLVLITILTTITSCSGKTQSPAIGKYEILRQAVLGNQWQMYQFQVKLDTGGKFDFDLLDLNAGDRVDGYYYIEEGAGITVEIAAGSSVLYSKESAGTTEATTESDRFNFTATQQLGTSYAIRFTNSGSAKNVTVFLELIYPVTGKIRVPLNTK